MRKILRYSKVIALAAFILGGVNNAFAQEVTLGFTTNSWNLPVGSDNKGTTSQTFTNGTYSITLEATSSGYYYNTAKYLMLGKKDATLTLPAFDFDVYKIEVVGNKGASSAVAQNIYVGENAVSTETKGAGTQTEATTNEYVIEENYQKAGTQYVLKVLSSHNTQITAINIYKKTESSKKSAGLAFSTSQVSLKKGGEFVSPTFTKSTTAEVTFVSDNADVASVDKSGVITLGGEVGTAVITATSAANEQYEAGTATCTIEVYLVNTYKKATSVVSGSKYLIVAQRDGKTMYAIPRSESETYGYLNTSTISEETDKIEVNTKYNDEFVITAVSGGYTIQDCYDRYLIQEGTYSAFQLTQEPGAWTIEPQVNGTFKISMNGYYIQWGQSTYTTFGLYTDEQEGAVLPMLYVFDDTASGISNITADTLNENAPIYNLAGQRVSKDTKGILIQNGKKFINK